jgi:dTDP-4-amino-4,6-dideoxygalactose transaminase
MTTTPEPVPFIDLRPRHAAMGEQLFERWRQDVERSDFILGRSTREFEEAFGAYIGSRHAIAVNSGTDALLLALAALGVGPGDDVIVPAFTFIATADAVIRLGARPVPADIDPKSYCSTVETLAAALTPQTKAIMPVHLYGNGAAMPEIMAWARERGLAVVEDAAQSTGTVIAGKQSGAWGDAGAFSFYPTKNLGAPGDGGLITTDRDDIAAQVRMMRDHGKDASGVMRILGYNSRMPTLIASYLLVQMPLLEDQLARRLENSRYYNERFADAEGIATPRLADGDTVNNYTLRIEGRVEGQSRRDALRDHLKAQGIGCAIYYLRPIHFEPVMEPYGYGPGDFPVAERAASEVLSLPIWPGLPEAWRERVADEVLAHVESGAVRA